MDPNEISEYVTEGVKWLAIGGATCFGSLVALEVLSSMFSKRIYNQDVLDKIVDEEARKLGIESPIGILVDRYEAVARVNRDGESQIVVGRVFACRSIVKHELYHIYKRDGGTKKSLLRYLFVEEPRAIIYGSIGAKL